MLPGLLSRVVPHSPDTCQSLIVTVHWGHHIWSRCVPCRASCKVVPPIHKTQCQNTRSSRIPRVWMELGYHLQTCSDTSHLLCSKLVWLDKSHDFRAHWAWPSILLPSMLRMMLEQWHSEHFRHRLKADLAPSWEAHACQCWDGSEARPLTTTHQLVQATAWSNPTPYWEWHAERQTRIAGETPLRGAFATIPCIDHSSQE